MHPKAQNLQGVDANLYKLLGGLPIMVAHPFSYLGFFNWTKVYLNMHI
jgi:hypothetical protein